MKQVSVDRKVGKAAKAERKGGPLSDQDRNLERPEEDEKKSQDRHQLMVQRRANRVSFYFFPDYDPSENFDNNVFEYLQWDEPDNFDYVFSGNFDGNSLNYLHLDEPDNFDYDPNDFSNYDDLHESPEVWNYWND